MAASRPTSTSPQKQSTSQQSGPRSSTGAPRNGSAQPRRRSRSGARRNKSAADAPLFAAPADTTGHRGSRHQKVAESNKAVTREAYEQVAEVVVPDNLTFADLGVPASLVAALAANGVTAKYLEGKALPSLRRILRTPERWDRIVTLAATLGERLPETANAGTLEEFLIKRQRADALRFPDLALSVVKLLGSGEYAVQRPGQGPNGHFGLAVRDYTHSTAPNRRFPDLITQRLLKAALAGRPPAYGDDELGALARHCTQQEDNAAKVERQVRKSAAALLLASRIGERFDALVTGASEKGTWVRILRPSVEGRLVRGVEGLDVGDHVQVELVSTDVERGYIDFARA